MTNEKILIEGKISKRNTCTIIFFVSAAILLIISLVFYATIPDRYIFKAGDYSYLFPLNNSAAFNFFFPEICIPFYLSIVCIIIAIIQQFRMGRCSIIVSDKRVCGTAAYGRSVDLPLDMISAVALFRFNGITVATSSGIIKFWFLENQSDVYNAITQLLIERQQGKAPAAATNSKTSSTTTELKELKDLYDAGVITEEEFNSKKKQLLGL